jgi:serine/threonine protein kinase
MDGNGNLKLADLGFAKLVFEGGRAYTVCGTPDYLAPEVIEHRGATRGSDYWALGILLFEFIAGCVVCRNAICAAGRLTHAACTCQLPGLPGRAQVVSVQEDLRWRD